MQAHSFISVAIRIILSVSALFIANSTLANDGYYHRGHHAYAQHYDHDRYDDYGRVIEARPIYQQVAIEVPRENCRTETFAQTERRSDDDSFAGTVIGGLVGAAIGHELGHGRGAATAAGGLIGATIGHDASGKRVVSYRDREVCRTHYRTEYENRIVGYDVSYSYQGRIYQTQTNNHPGDRIDVTVDVQPHYRR
jgi:uncharacterized protein YcfJ